MFHAKDEDDLDKGTAVEMRGVEEFKKCSGGIICSWILLGHEEECRAEKDS